MASLILNMPRQELETMPLGDDAEVLDSEGLFAKHGVRVGAEIRSSLERLIAQHTVRKGKDKQPPLMHDMLRLEGDFRLVEDGEVMKAFLKQVVESELPHDDEAPVAMTTIVADEAKGNDVSVTFEHNGAYFALVNVNPIGHDNDVFVVHGFDDFDPRDIHEALRDFYVSDPKNDMDEEVIEDDEGPTRLGRFFRGSILALGIFAGGFGLASADCNSDSTNNAQNPGGMVEWTLGRLDDLLGTRMEDFAEGLMYGSDESSEGSGE